MNDSRDGNHRRQYYISPEDKAWALKRLKERGLNKAQLAKLVGMKRQGIYWLFDRATHSWDWPTIVAALGGTPPSGIPMIPDERLRTIIRRWPEMSEADRQLMEQMSTRFGAKKP